jgi:hypothetical protein
VSLGSTTVQSGDGDGRHFNLNRKPAPWVPRLQTSDLETNLSQTEADNDEKEVESPEKASGESLTKITLIRRDPSSGLQWNVGTISVESRRHSLALLGPVEITLTSPGYGRFARSQKGPETPSSASPSHNSAKKDLFFKRRVGFRPLPEEHRSSLQHVRANSGDFLSDITNTSAKKARQVYSFTSPWQGICTFSNGVDGKSLKCRHSIPGHTSSESGAGVGTAELRFNLPWSVLRPRDANRTDASTEGDKLPISQLLEKPAKPREQWRRSVQTFKPKAWVSRPHSTTITEGQRPKIQLREAETEEESRISLKLGREKAGGGFKGHSAKLGKLIIEDEGLKMCDLTVAACMGVWWQHYMESF